MKHALQRLVSPYTITKQFVGAPAQTQNLCGIVPSKAMLQPAHMPNVFYLCKGLTAASFAHWPQDELLHTEKQAHQQALKEGELAVISTATCS